MQSLNGGRHWGVILAGGDGERLRPLTRLIAGDDRPKQFCPFAGRKKDAAGANPAENRRGCSAGPNAISSDASARTLLRR